jgi:hypothetical protein
MLTRILYDHSNIFFENSNTILFNKNLFQIFFKGMFPYTMIATTAIFYPNNWPKKFLREKIDTKNNSQFYISKLSNHCIYEKIQETITNTDQNNGKKVLSIDP